MDVSEETQGHCGTPKKLRRWRGSGSLGLLGSHPQKIRSKQRLSGGKETPSERGQLKRKHSDPAFCESLPMLGKRVL